MATGGRVEKQKDMEDKRDARRQGRGTDRSRGKSGINAMMSTFSTSGGNHPRKTCFKPRTNNITILESGGRWGNSEKFRGDFVRFPTRKMESWT
jgi:hypothetical protein